MSFIGVEASLRLEAIRAVLEHIGTYSGKHENEDLFRDQTNPYYNPIRK